MDSNVISVDGPPGSWWSSFQSRAATKVCSALVVMSLVCNEYYSQEFFLYVIDQVRAWSWGVHLMLCSVIMGIIT